LCRIFEKRQICQGSGGRIVEFLKLKKFYLAEEKVLIFKTEVFNFGG
jgi:hypothetical protein